MLKPGNSLSNATAEDFFMSGAKVKNAVITMKQLSIVFAIILNSVNISYAQVQDWILYNTSNSGIPDNQVQAIAIDKNDVKWIGTANGLVRFDGTNWTIYNKDNSSLPSSMIRAITIDKHQNIWVGTDKGLAKFDGNKMAVYDAQNSVLVNDAITAIGLDKKSGDLWIGTEKGLAKFDGVNWRRFDDNNSELLTDYICSVAIDGEGVIWVATFDHFQFAGRLTRFDGAKWTTIRLEQKELNSSFPGALVVDSENVLWMGIKGTMGGALVRIQGSNWDIYNRQTSAHIVGGISSVVLEGNKTWMGSGAGLISFNISNSESFTVSNSKLPDNYVYTVEVDKKGNKWIGTISGGLAVYKEGGIKSEQETIDSASMVNVYPNPIKSSTTISYRVSEKSNVTISIYNSAGLLQEIVQNKIVDRGHHTVTWNPAYSQNGIYFCTVRQGKKILTKKLIVTHN